MKSKLLVFLLATILAHCNAQNKKPTDFSQVGKAVYPDTQKLSNNLMMNEDHFWTIINTLKNSSLRDMLNPLTSDEILQFDLRFDSLMSMAYDYKLWGAAYVINGGCSDDCFQDFLSNLITQGKQRFYSTLRDPETCADWIKSEKLVDEMPYVVVYELYTNKTGKEPPQQQLVKFELKGKPFNESTVFQLYPKLAKRFLNR